MKIGLATPIDIEVLSPHLDLAAGTVPPQGLGGSATTPLVQGLLAAGHTVSVYTLGRNIPEPVVLRGPRLTVYVGNFRPRARQHCLDLFAAEAAVIRQFIDLDQPDIVHAHWGYEFALGALDSGWPCLITLHDNPWTILRYQPDLYRVVRLLLKLRVLHRGRNRHFTAVSPYLAATLATANRHLTVVPNAVLPGPGGVRPCPTGPGRRIISVLTGWSARKNATTALRAFQQVRQQLGAGTEYWLFGPDYGPGEMAERWAQAEGLAEGVHFAGLLDHEAMLRHLPSFDVLLHPAREESFGLTLVEAMQAGVPVVGGQNSGAVPWVLADGQCGILTDIDSVDAVAAAVLQVFTQPVLYETLSARGVKRVAAHFSQQAVTAAYESLYHQVLTHQQPTTNRPHALATAPVPYRLAATLLP